MSDATVLNRQVLSGAAPPLLLLHGWGQSLVDLKPLGELLNRRLGYAVHLLDLPGFGTSPAPPPEGWNTSQYAARVLEYLDDNAVEQAVLVAHSFGGRIAIRIASSAPQRVAKLVLIDSAGVPPRRTLRRWLRLTTSRLLGQAAQMAPPPLRERLYAYRNRHFASQDYRRASGMRTTLVKTVTEDLRPQLATITAPTLLLWGELDTDVPLYMADTMQGLIQGAQLVILPGKDHFPFATAPDLCAYHIAQFLAEAAAAAAPGR